jgi:hypothetical protein
VRLESSSAKALPPATSLHVVSDPVAAGKVVVVVSLSASRTLELSGVNPVNKAVVWQMPYSTSLITPGVSPDPVVSGGIVVDLDPELGPTKADVVVQGVKASTGAVVWRMPGFYVVNDEPNTCAGKNEICIPVASASGTDLKVLTASTGRLIARISGVVRSMDGAGLYESAAAAPTLEKISATARVEWRKTVASLFGPGYTPDAGWDFEPRSGLDVGTIGVALQGFNYATGQIEPGGAAQDLAKSKTVGIAENNGSLLWTAPGMYDCGGTLQFLSTPVLCSFTGSIFYASETAHPVFRGVTLSLEGLDPKKGVVTWRRPVSNVKTVSEGLSVPFLDGSHIVVRGPAGLEILNVTTGATSGPANGTDYWCEHTGTYTEVSVAGDYSHGHHSAAPTFGSCSASGVAQTGVPRTQSSTVGIRVAGRFVWISPKGLEVVPIR